MNRQYGRATIPDEGERTELRSRTSAAEGIGENFRHIVCFLCYPAFSEARAAPHDAECICGKPIKRGSVPGRADAPQCVLCDEMAQGHYRSAHGGDRPD